MAIDVDAVRLARAYLLRVAEPPAPALTTFVATHGPVRAAELVAGDDMPPEIAEEISDRGGLDLVDADIAAAAKVGARLVIPEDDEWPTQQLADLSACQDRRLAPPVALWVRGSARLDQAIRRAICVTGARAATGYGEHVSSQFGYDLANANRTVVGGMSYGIDAGGHRGALAADGVTVAVQGCGVDVPYPSGNARLLERVTARGLIISEYPPGTQPARRRLIARGRLLASLTEATVVVEAGPRSGARITAVSAALLGRPVMAVPGPITSAMSTVCHHLLRDGTATLVTSVPDILDTISQVSPE